MSVNTVANGFAPKTPFTPANPRPEPYKNAGEHMVVFNSANKTSGTRGNFQIPIQMSSILDAKNIHYVKVVNMSGFSVSSPSYSSVYVSIPTLTQPFSYNSMSGLENTLVGILPPYMNASGTITFLANQNDNSPTYIGDCSGLIKSGFFNIQLIDPTTGNIIVPSVDYILTLEFS